MEDEKIIEMYFKREEHALYETKIKYGRQIYSVALGLMECHEDAEECEDDTYLRTWNSIPPRRPEYLRAYCMKICRNLALRRIQYKNRYKRRGKLVELTKELEECLPECRICTIELYERRRETIRVINAFLDGLNDRQHAVFVRRYWGFQSLGQIAGDLNMSSGQVGGLLHRLRKKLRNALEKEEICV
ncbi:MAG: RNA polymerase sigma factor [Butyrivibrio sp.]